MVIPYILLFMNYDCLIIEGGGFKTAFTSGVVDTLITNKFDPFKTIIGISGGSVVMSYYLSEQYRFCINALKVLAKDKHFTQFRRTFSEKGYLDIDYLAEVALDKVPFNVEAAIEKARSKNVIIIATDRKTGNPEYLSPTAENWIQCVIASSTLPFATKGTHTLDSKVYFDGGWSDPLPVEWAYNNGMRNILLIRTKPPELRIKQSWADYFGSKYFASTPKLSKTFELAFEKYNKALDFIDNQPDDLKIDQIAPKRFLNSGTYAYTKKSLMADYRYGLDCGIKHLNRSQKGL